MCIKNTYIQEKQCEAYVEDLNRVELIDYFNTLAQNTKETPFQCEGCKKFYSYKRSLSKHMESICPHTKKEKSVTISASVLNELLEKGLNKILEELKQQFVPQTINNTNINTNIILNCFYSPNMEHVEKSFLTDCILNQDLPTVIERVYYLGESPENRSIYLDENGSYSIYEDGKWVKNSDVVKELFDQGFRFLSCHRRENRSEVEPLLSCDTKNWFDAIIDEDDEIVDPIMKDIKLSLSNNKSTLKQKIKF